LPNVDDDIDSELGLAVFYQYVGTAALNQEETQYVITFTTESFANYLHISYEVSAVHTNGMGRLTSAADLNRLNCCQSCRYTIVMHVQNKWALSLLSINQ